MSASKSVPCATTDNYRNRRGGMGWKLTSGSIAAARGKKNVGERVCLLKLC